MGCPSLADVVRPQDTVTIVFSDITRPMPNDRVLPVLVDALVETGIPGRAYHAAQRLNLSAQSADELRTMLGNSPGSVSRSFSTMPGMMREEVVGVARNRAGRIVRVNRAYMDASIRILTGFVEPHFFAGFSGGPKAVLPGIADVESIMDNHGARLLSHPQATWARTTGNPLWEELCSVAVATQPTFLLNVTLNRERSITGVFAGEMLTAHRAAIGFVAAHAMRPVVAPFDVVITSNSGYPLDLNLYQAVKGMSAAAQIVKPGGDIIVAAECWDGIPEHGEYGRLLREATSAQELLSTIRAPGFRCTTSGRRRFRHRFSRRRELMSKRPHERAVS